MASVTTFFASLGAPLVNPRWSWGALRRSDGTIFLRVWQDLKLIEDGQSLMLLDGRNADIQDALGYKERQRHIESIRNGARCFLVMCTVDDPKASPRKIREFNDQEVFAGGEIVERNGKVYIRRGERLLCDAVKL